VSAKVTRPRVAVVGAGMAGLVAARTLADAGCAVTVFEKSRGPGGRCATRRSEVGPFHHGVAGFGASTAAFRQALVDWQATGWAAADAAGRWAGRPTMNALARQLAEGLALRTEHTVRPPLRNADGTWQLATAEHGTLPETFDVLLLAVPAEQTRPLCADSPSLLQALAGVHGQPCWTLMLGWPPEAAAPALPDPARVAASPLLAEVVDVSALPGTAPAAGPGWQRWVLHATAAWSTAELERTPDEATAALLAALQAVAAPGKPWPAPAHAVAHRWRYAQVAEPAAGACGWDAALRMGSCGDAWGRGDSAAPPEGVERAWLSGRALAQAVLAGA